MLDPEEDARLVEGCLRGEERAWTALVKRHERLVYAVGRSYRLNDEDMGDVFQEVFTALYKGLPRLNDSRALVRWLSSTADRIARTAALRTRKQEARQTGDPEALEDLPSGEELGHGLEELETQALVRLALTALPDRCRNLLTLLYYQDPPLSYQEVSRALGIPPGSLGPTRARCFEKLRSALEAQESGRAGIRNPPSPTSPIDGPREGAPGLRRKRHAPGKQP